MDAAILDPELLEGFFLDVDETFSPQVAAATEHVRQGDLQTGVDMMLRPLHTIKGTAAFLGMEEISAYAHAVEDHLKAMQTGSAPQDATFMLRCVDMLFHLLERAQHNTPFMGAGHLELMETIHAGGQTPSPQSIPELLDVQRHGSVTVLRLLTGRIHLPNQYGPLLQSLAKLPDSSEVLLDLSLVRTLNSTAWGGLWLAGGRLTMHVAGMSQACQSTFASWGFAARITAYSDAAAFWQQRGTE